MQSINVLTLTVFEDELIPKNPMLHLTPKFRF